MGIFSRISDIISANFNDMVDGMENPEKMLRQAVREMETAIQNAKESTAKTIANKKMVENELDKNRQQVKLWTSRAQTAVSDGNDDLAKKAIARKQEHEKLVIALEDEITETDIAIQKLRHQLSGMQSKLAEAKRRLATLCARKRVADLQTKLNKVSDGNALNKNAFAKFDRMREKVELAEAQADAMRELDCDTVETDCMSGICDETANIEVEAELAELKKKVTSN